MTDKLLAEAIAFFDSQSPERRIDQYGHHLRTILAAARAQAEDRKDAERYQDMLFELGAMENAPCFVCGYNGPGYFQPTKHACAARHHDASPINALPEEIDIPPTNES